MMFTYGHKVSDEHDEWINLAEAANRSLEVLVNVGTHPVYLFPALRHAPKYIFGRAFAQRMDHMQYLAEQLVSRPYLAVKQNLNLGIAKPSLASTLIDAYTTPDGVTKDENVIRNVLAGAYVAGADSMVSTLDTAILALMLYPDVQAEAHRILDACLLGERLPTFDDRDQLLYIDAVLWEALRWNPVGPLAVPHRLIQKDTYNGMTFPAGTMFIANSWHLLQDETVFSDPTTFDPGRFLTTEGRLRSDILDPRKIAFGYGRRKCPGQHLAESSLWIAIATLLSSFEILLPVDENGSPIVVEPVFFAKLLSHPRPIKCVFKPRNNITQLVAELDE